MAPPQAGTRDESRAKMPRRRRTPLAFTTSVLLLAAGGVSRVSCAATAASAAAATVGGSVVELVDASGKLASASEMTSLLRYGN